jgi:hypothetical protein
MTNCLLFATRLYWRRKGRGYLCIRRSRWGKFFHVLYAEKRAGGTLRLVSFVPTNPKHKKLPPPLFKGKVKWGDL